MVATLHLECGEHSSLWILWALPRCSMAESGFGPRTWRTWGRRKGRVEEVALLTEGPQVVTGKWTSALLPSCRGCCLRALHMFQTACARRVGPALLTTASPVSGWCRVGAQSIPVDLSGMNQQMSDHAGRILTSMQLSPQVSGACWFNLQLPESPRL